MLEANVDAYLAELAHERDERVNDKPAAKRAARLAVAFKLIAAAQDRWRAFNAPHLVALVRAHAKFINGHLAEGPAHTAA